LRNKVAADDKPRSPSIYQADAMVRVRGLRRQYGAVSAVNGLNLDVFQGEVLVLLGPNGAGKTTTIEIVEGLRKRDSGDVAVLGVDPACGDRA
jgi:ABC-2 type transport system ATP-binding protein